MDPLLAGDWELTRSSGEWESTCLYRRGFDFIDRLNEYVEENIWSCGVRHRAALVRSVMFRDLNTY